MTESLLLTSTNYGYGVKSVRELRRTTRVLTKSPTEPSVLKKKVLLYDYFLKQVDPIVSKCVTHLLFAQPDDVVEEMIRYLNDLKNSVAEDNNDITVKTRMTQKVYLATRISPVISILVNKVAIAQPVAVIDFMLSELEVMPRRPHVHFQPEPQITLSPVDAENSDPSSSMRTTRGRRPTSAIPKKSPSPVRASNQYKNEDSNRPLSAPSSNSANTTAETSNENRNRPSELMKIQVGLFGLDGSGKTSFINAAQGSFDPKVRPTIGFRPTNMMLGESVKVNFYDLGGGKKIREIWEQYYHDIHALIYVVDASTSAEVLEESASVFRAVRSNPLLQGKPAMILANKQDQCGARSAEEIRELFGVSSAEIGKLLQVFECSCVPKSSRIKQEEEENMYIEDEEDDEGSGSDPEIERSLEWLLTMLQRDFEELDARIREDTKKKNGDEAKKRLARERRVLRNKIASAFIDRIDPALLPAEVIANPDDLYGKEDGITFLASEIGEDKANLSEIAVEIGELIGFQRLALQMVGGLRAPVSKKKTALTWEEIREIVVELRQELGLEP